MSANFFSRVSAYIVDMILIIICLNVITIGIKSDDTTSKEMKELTTSFQQKEISTKQYYAEYQKLYYQTQKDNNVVNILSIVLTIGYFIVFQYLNNGQTIGKKIFGIRVVNKNKGRVNLKQIVIRSLFIYSLLSAIINVIIINFLSIKSFYSVSTIVTVIDTLFILVTMLFILFNKEKRGFHDLLAGTKVITKEEV